ncbi:unnamed protein product [Arabidopsis halleri]
MGPCHQESSIRSISVVTSFIVHTLCFTLILLYWLSIVHWKPNSL